MSSSNEINGTPSPANVQLSQEFARETFGFNGYFTSDCDAVYIMQAGHDWIPPNSTITATVRYYGTTATGSFVVDVQ